MMAHSTPTMSHAIAICAVADMNEGRRVIIFFLEPAKMRAILLVFVTKAPYIIANAKPGTTRVTRQVRLLGFATKKNVFKWHKTIATRIM